VFSGSGECAEVVWRFLGLSMPTWVLICLVSLGIFGLIVNRRSAWNSLAQN
jgi:disulfide bond formation protein DsbB